MADALNLKFPPSDDGILRHFHLVLLLLSCFSIDVVPIQAAETRGTARNRITQLFQSGNDLATPLNSGWPEQIIGHSVSTSGRGSWPAGASGSLSLHTAKSDRQILKGKSR